MICMLTLAKHKPYPQNSLLPPAASLLQLLFRKRMTRLLGEQFRYKPTQPITTAAARAHAELPYGAAKVLQLLQLHHPPSCTKS
jgi:hypothetical protein